MLDLERTLRLGGVALVLAGCSTPPSQVISSGSSDEPTTTTSATTDGSDSTADASATAGSHDGSGTTSGSTGESATTLPVDDSSTTMVDPSTTSSSSGDPSTGEPLDCHPLLVEVLYDPPGGNNNKQWVKLFNPCSVEIELSETYSLGWGGSDYTYGTIDLEGSIPPDGCFVVGGPNSENGNANPVYQQATDLSPDLQVSGDDADGVALFLDMASAITAETIPVDAVIYGVANTSGLLDSNGDTPTPHVADAPSNHSIRRTGDMLLWIVERNPQPNECPPN